MNAIKSYNTQQANSYKDIIIRMWTRLAVSLVLLLLSSALFFQSGVFKPELPKNVFQPTSVEALNPAKQEFLGRSEPVHLRIEKVGIDAPFIALGLKNDGTMQTPSDGKTVGWYRYAPTPGEIGPAVVAAHVDTKAGPAVFARLDELSPGDMFTIERADGSVATFAVTELKEFSQNNFPTEEIYGNLDYAGIRLITCAGTFDRKAKRYSHNTIVFGKLVP